MNLPIPLLVEFRGAQAVIGRKVDHAASFVEQLHDDMGRGAMGQAGQRHIGSLGNLLRCQILDRQSNAADKRRMHVRKHASVGLATRRSDDLDMRVIDQPLDRF